MLPQDISAIPAYLSQDISAKLATMSNVSAVAFVLALALLAVFHCERDTNFILLQYQLKNTPCCSSSAST